MTDGPPAMVAVVPIGSTLEEAMAEVARRFAEDGAHGPIRWRGPFTVEEALRRIARPNDLSPAFIAALEAFLTGLAPGHRIIVATADAL